jgi:hypothetical protein
MLVAGLVVNEKNVANTVRLHLAPAMLGPDRQGRAKTMIEVHGTSPNGERDRIAEFELQGANVSIWVHAPRSNAGQQIIVPLSELQAALRQEGISG